MLWMHVIQSPLNCEYYVEHHGSVSNDCCNVVVWIFLETTGELLRHTMYEEDDGVQL